VTDVIRWEEPPAEHGNAKAELETIANALRARPGEWAVVAEDKTSGSATAFAFRIRTGSGPFAPARHFEARAIGPAQGSSSKVYARYVGEVTK
jgi:hypothetical protein